MGFPARKVVPRTSLIVKRAGEEYWTAWSAWRNKLRYDLTISWLLGLIDAGGRMERIGRS